jgi:hypothetical protein
MIMVADYVPGLKRFLHPTGLRRAVMQTTMRMMITFIWHSGRMSCLQAAGSIRSETCHRAQIGRLLRRPSVRPLDPNKVLRQALLAQESSCGLFLFLIDATLCSQAGTKTENTYSTGNRQRRPQKGRRYGKQKHARKRCHSFTMGLLITPSGIRIPYSRPHYTLEYCQKKGLPHRTTAEAAADLIRELPLPEDAQVMVLGDTAYDADAVRAACADRGYEWIFPCNPERVLAGAKPRRKVRSFLKDWKSFSLQTVRLFPGRGPYVNYRRLSPHRVGPKAKPRTFYVHQERRDVRSVGKVRLVFSTTKAQLKAATPDDVKILMTNAARLSLRAVVELYALRWQIELFFKELKSTFGFHQYRFRKFACVENWTELALTAFLYLENYRAEQLARRGLTEKEKQWWRHQRTHGLCQAVRLASEQSELRYLAQRLETPGGITKLKRLIRNSFAPEYRAAA